MSWSASKRLPRSTHSGALVYTAAFGFLEEEGETENRWSLAYGHNCKDLDEFEEFITLQVQAFQTGEEEDPSGSFPKLKSWTLLERLSLGQTPGCYGVLCWNESRTSPGVRNQGRRCSTVQVQRKEVPRLPRGRRFSVYLEDG